MGMDQRVSLVRYQSLEKGSKNGGQFKCNLGGETWSVSMNEYKQEDVWYHCLSLSLPTLGDALVLFLLADKITLIKKQQRKGLLGLTVPAYSPFLWVSQGTYLKYDIHNQEQREDKYVKPWLTAHCLLLS